MKTQPFFLHGISNLCFMAAEGEGEAAGGGATGTEVGGTTRVTVANDGEADARATAESTSSGAKPGEAEATARPEGLPEGFDSIQAFVEAVNAGTYKPAGAEATTQEETQQPAIPEAVQEAFKDERIAPFSEEFTAQGDLSEESRGKAAAALNVPRGLVDAYVDSVKAGRQAAVTVEAAPFHQAAGGQEEWGKFQAWTTQEGNLTPATESAYQSLMAAGKTTEALAVIQPVIAAWRASGDGPAARDVTLEGGAGTGGNATESYANWSQVEKDMNHPDYARDPAFRARVEEKLARSTNL